MIKAYLAGISTPYEGEDIIVQYSIFDEQKLIDKQSLMLEYRKPAIVGLVALNTLLIELKNYVAKEIIIYVNDSAINEIIKGTTTTKNNDVLKLAISTRRRFGKFENILIKDISKNVEEMKNWNEVLKF